MDFTPRLSIAAALIVAGVILNASAGQAATYYVNKSGSDANGCATAQSSTNANAKLTIAGGISCLTAGDTLNIGNGIYTENFSNPFGAVTGTSWAANQRILVQAENKGGVTITPALPRKSSCIGHSNANQKYIEWNGLVVDALAGTPDTASNRSCTFGLLVWAHSHHIRFRNMTVRNIYGAGVSILKDAGGNAEFNEVLDSEISYTAWSQGSGLQIDCFGQTGSPPPAHGYCHGFYVNGDNNLMERVHVHHSNGYGIQIYPGGNTGNIVRNSTLHHNWAGMVGVGSAIQILNNVIYSNPNGAIVVSGTSSIYNNTIYNHTNGWGGLTNNGGTHTVKNNIFYLSNSTNVTPDSTNLVGTNPLFVNAAASNFRLQAGSPAIDRGAMLPLVPEDIDGTARPQGSSYDIGAYEFGGGAANPAPDPPVNLRVH